MKETIYLAASNGLAIGLVFALGALIYFQIFKSGNDNE